MQKILLGIKDPNLKYDFRETCFGLYKNDNQVLVMFDKEHNQYSFIGGGIEKSEKKEEALQREFLEEVGIRIKNIQPFITIDCFWLAGGDYPLESLANFYTIDIEGYLDVECESQYEFVDIHKLDLPLPYQRKALELFLKEK